MKRTVPGAMGSRRNIMIRSGALHYPCVRVKILYTVPNGVCSIEKES